MNLMVHHQFIDAAHRISAYDGQQSWDFAGNSTHGSPWLDFLLQGVRFSRLVEFRFRWNDASGGANWEREELKRRIRIYQAEDVWSFEDSPRLMYMNPFPSGVAYAAGAILTVHLITDSVYAGGQLYAWDPYHGSGPTYIDQTSRTNDTSVFQFPLQDWMTGGFNFKFVNHAGSDHGRWENDAANRIWRPADGTSVWVVSGQASVRRSEPTPVTFPVEVLFPASLASPGALTLIDPGEGSRDRYDPVIRTHADSLFKVATYPVEAYPDSAYGVQIDAAAENGNPYYRPFPSPYASLGGARHVSSSAHSSG